MFESAKKKIEKGFASLQLFSEELDTFVASKPAHVVRNGKSDIVYTLIVMDKQVSLDTLIIAGEAAHHFRSALDHCAWALHKGGQIQETMEHKIYFPVASKRRNFNEAIRDLKFKDTVLADHFRSLECYKNGKGELIHFLSEMDNHEKHRVITPAFTNLTVKGMTELTKYPGHESTAPLPDKTHRVASGQTQYFPSPSGGILSAQHIAQHPKNGTKQIDNVGTVEVEIGFSDPAPPIDGSMIEILTEIGKRVEEIVLEIEKKVPHKVCDPREYLR